LKKMILCLLLVLLASGCATVSDDEPATEESSSKTQIAAGAFHTVGLNKEGYVISAGSNSHGQGMLDTWTEIQAIAAGSYHTLGLKTDGTVLMAGSTVGPSGVNDSDKCSVDTWADITQVAAGGCQMKSHSVGLRSDGTVVACGDNSSGQCNVDDFTDIIQVAAGGEHTVALRKDGTVTAVGKNYFGQLNVDGWTDIIQVAAGVEHTIGLKADGSVVAVGDNEGGQLSVSDWEDIIQVAAGDFHSVGLKSDGTVVAAGSNEMGQIGVVAWSDIVQIAAGWNHTVGLKADDTALAAGDGSEGQTVLGGPFTNFNSALSLSDSLYVNDFFEKDNDVEILHHQDYVLVRVSQNPEAGFHWPYYLFIPYNVRDNPHILVESNNHGLQSTDDFAFFDGDVRLLVQNSYMNSIARGLQVPLLMPVFPQPLEPWNLHIDALDRKALTEADGDLKRVDLQLRAMIIDAQVRLRNNNIQAQDKILMHGFSRSGMFATAFSILHPDIVQALATGHLGWPLPATEWDGTILTYPIGIADVEDITEPSLSVDLEAYRRVHKYFYLGGEDRYPASYTLSVYYDKNESNILYKHFGKDQLDEWAVVQSIFAANNFPAQFVIYDGVEHTILSEMENDVIKFLERNSHNEKLIIIEPHQYP
jgi:hypothetical protein